MVDTGLSISDKIDTEPLSTVAVQEQRLVAPPQAADANMSDLVSHNASADLDTAIQSESQETDGHDQTIEVMQVDENGVPIPNPLELDPLRDEYDEALKPTYAALPRLE